MRMTRILAAAAIGLGAVFSQGTPVTAQTLRVLEGATSATLRVPMNRAVVVESDMLFAELSVANPAIADIATLSERSIYILGRAPGRTTMTLLSAEGSLIANVEIQVVPDVAELRERLGEILPGEAVEVRTANDGIVLSGTVSSLQAVDRAMQLAETLHPGRRVEHDAGGRHPTGDAAGPLRRDAAQRAAGAFVVAQHRQQRCDIRIERPGKHQPDRRTDDRP